MPLQVTKSIPGRNGGIYAYRGAVLEDDDPVALANPNCVCAVDAPPETARGGGASATAAPPPTAFEPDPDPEPADTVDGGWML